MKIVTLVVDGKNGINLMGDLSPQDVKSIVESVIFQQTYNTGMAQGQIAERQRIRQGFRRRRKRNVGEQDKSS